MIPDGIKKEVQDGRLEVVQDGLLKAAKKYEWIAATLRAYAERVATTKSMRSKEVVEAAHDAMWGAANAWSGLEQALTESIKMDRDEPRK